MWNSRLRRNKPLLRRTPIRKKSPQGTLNDRLHKLLKRAVILRDGYHCKRCSREPTDWLPVDCAHIYPKGIHESMRFVLENVFLLCRDCHDWFDGKRYDSDFTKS